MKNTDLNKLVEDLSKITEKLNELNVRELYSTTYEREEKVEHFLEIVHELNQEEVGQLIEYISSYHNIYFFPKESILDDIKAEEILENWNK